MVLNNRVKKVRSDPHFLFKPIIKSVKNFFSRRLSWRDLLQSLFFIVPLVVLAIMLVWVWIGYNQVYPNYKAAELIGVKETRDNVTEFFEPPKTIWDLLDLLIVPLALAAGAAYLDLSNKKRQFAIEEERLKDARYRNYLSSMEKLILEHGLLEQNPESSCQYLAQAYTRDVIKEINGMRIGELLDFLESYRLDLIDPERPQISLRGLRFKKAIMSFRNIRRVNLAEVILHRSEWNKCTCDEIYAPYAKFFRATIHKANFNNCNFENVEFKYSDLRDTIFDSCKLNGADFFRTNLTGTVFKNCELRNVNWEKSKGLDKKYRLYIEIIDGNEIKKDYPSIDLSGMVFKEADLSGKNLAGADLSHCDFSDANLRGANLHAARLRQAKFRGATLIDANIAEKWKLVSEILTEKGDERDLTGRDLRNAYLQNASLRNARLSGANLSGADLMRADLSGAVLRGAIFQDRQTATWSGANNHEEEQAPLMMATLMKEANLKEADFGETDLSNISLDGAFLKNTVLPDNVDPKWKAVRALVSGEWGVGADFTNQDLSNANLTGANLSGIKFTGASMENANLTGAILTGADFSHARLQKAKLKNADLSNTNFRKANLSEADFRGTKLKKTDLQGANLYRANFSEAELIKADFYTANLADADFSAATFKKTIMADGSIRDIRRG
jgi:uncharacterized protein YjbI with pentapeptide repeats